MSFPDQFKCDALSPFSPFSFSSIIQIYQKLKFIWLVLIPRKVKLGKTHLSIHFVQILSKWNQFYTVYSKIGCFGMNIQWKFQRIDKYFFIENDTQNLWKAPKMNPTKRKQWDNFINSFIGLLPWCLYVEFTHKLSCWMPIGGQLGTHFCKWIPKKGWKGRGIDNKRTFLLKWPKKWQKWPDRKSIKKEKMLGDVL